MRILALDIGSSSIKSAMLEVGRVVGTIARTPYPTQRDSVRSEVDPDALLAAIGKSIHAITDTRSADILALSVMSPAWVAMDRDGKALTPIITHQDRRSIEEARALIREVGEDTLLNITGNLPFPGGISSTTLKWAFANFDGLKSRVDLIGHLNTFVLRQLAGARASDPGNASFTGLYETVAMGSWSRVMLDAVGVNESTLPAVMEGNQIAGKVTPAASSEFGLRAGLPVTTGLIDTSAAMLLASADEGRLLHVCGTTDVLALCTKSPRPDPTFLTRALGTSGVWMHAATMASAGSTLDWARSTFFADETSEAFQARLTQLEHRDPRLRFDPYLAGERTSIEQRTAELLGLSLNTDRQAILSAILAGLARVSSQRLPRLLKDRQPLPDVIVSGGAGGILERLFHADWPAHLRYRHVEEATLLGLWKLAEMAN